jgi:hypothetical protein
MHRTLQLEEALEKHSLTENAVLLETLLEKSHDFHL